MAKKPDNCPECGGEPRGRGYAHRPGCSKASRPLAAGAKREDRRLEFPPRVARVQPQNGLPDVSGLTVDALVRLRIEIDRVLTSRADELREQADTMNAILDSMEKGKK